MNKTVHKMSVVVLLAFFFFCSLAVYAPSLQGKFVFDDNFLIGKNPLIKDIRKLPRVFVTDAFWPSSLFVERTYRYYMPLPALSFALDYFIWKYDSFWFHLENIFLHSLNALLVFLLIFSVFGNYPLSFLTGLLFCVHPIHAESVNYISARADLLLGIFTLLTLLFYLRHLKTGRGVCLAASFFTFILALLTKEAGFLFLLPVFTVFFARGRLPISSVVLHALIFSGISAIYIWLRLTVLVPIELIPGGGRSLLLDTINFFSLLLEYIKLFIFPYPLYMLRTIPEVVSFVPVQLVGPAALALITCLVLYRAVKKGEKAVVFGIAWFLLGTLYLFKFMHRIPGMLSAEEHWLYVPSIGLMFLAAYLILKIRTRGPRIITAAVVTLFFIGLGNVSARNWSEPLKFYRYQLSKITPGMSYVMRAGMVSALLNYGRDQEALALAREMVYLYGKDWTYVVLGDILRDMRRYEEAKEAYEAALRLDYFCVEANVGLMRLSELTGKTYEDKFMNGIPPEEAEAVRYVKLGRYEEARVVLERLLASSPSAKLYTLAGIALNKTGCYRAAINSFLAALEINPSHLPALANLATAYYNAGERRKSEETAEKLKTIIESSRKNGP